MPNGWVIDGGGDIVIRGGSCELIYNDGKYPRDPANPNKHKNIENQKVVRVIITGEISFDTGDHPDGMTCEIITMVK